jgi:hypothetical protein
MTHVDYAARFEGFDSDTLFELEHRRGEMDDASDHVEQLLVVLADWRQEILAGRRVDEDDYRRCLDAVREAWLQYSFRWTGGPNLPYPFDLPQRVAS